MDVAHFLDEEFSELYHYIGIDVPNAVPTTATINQGTPERLFSLFCCIYLDAEGPWYSHRDGSISLEVIPER